MIMKGIEWLKSNIRIIMFVIVLAVAISFLFIPALGPSDGGGEDPTVSSVSNIQFDIELAGGTRIRAPLDGTVAEGVENVTFENQEEIESNIADELDGIPARDVTVRPPEEAGQKGSIEITNENATTDELENALNQQGIEYESVRAGVTEETRSQTVRVLRDKINAAGLTGGSVQSVESSTSDQYFILIEVPGEDRESVTQLIEERGQVRVDIYYPTEENGNTTYQTRENVLSSEDFGDIGSARTDSQSNVPVVPVTVTSESAEGFQNDVVETGVAQDGGSTCTYEQDPESSEACLLTLVDDEVIYSAGMSSGLAQQMQSGDWSKDPQFVLQTGSIEEAQQLEVNLRAGALPASLDTEQGTTSFISPSQGEEFRVLGLVVGILAVFMVSISIYVRYRDHRVALPMLVTAFSEVIILLGFAAFIGYPIDLAVVGSLIAVVGTGVDDLVIIADQVIHKGEAKTGQVFDSRFSKAFWVIAAAASTTIVAMSPLAILSLGDLRGFAIFTILGVLVGVIVTRPAYGYILRKLFVKNE